MFEFLRKSRKEIDETLSLKQLERFFEYDKDLSRKIREEQELEIADLKKRYGDKWWDVYRERHFLVVTEEMENREYRIKFNQEIYDGKYYLDQCSPSMFERIQRNREQRMKEVYGDAYERLYRHKEGNPEVVELLLQDAVKTGRWDELPECLQQECQKRMFGKKIAK